MKRRIALEASRTLAVYGFAGWVYIVLMALFQPNTLGMQLTHFAPLPHEDTFGEICFAVSIVSFFVYNLLRSADGPQDRVTRQVPGQPSTSVSRSAQGRVPENARESTS